MQLTPTMAAIICEPLDQFSKLTSLQLKGCRMGRSDKVSLWYVALLINTRFRFFILESAIVKRI